MKEKILQLLNDIVINFNVGIVDCVIFGSNNLVIQILLEKNDDSMITIDECAKISRKLSFLLDENNVLDSKYTLEVSSAGIDRPLIKIEDFIKYKNNNVLIKTSALIDARKTFRGLLQDVIGDTIVIQTSVGVVEISFSLIEKANLDIVKDYNINGDKKNEAK